MKKTILAIAILAMIGVTNGFSQTEKNETTENTMMTIASFGVRGNCNMCKKTIEKAANSVEGVHKSHWNKDTKSIMVGYDISKTDLKKVHKAIAASGYDTEEFSGDVKAYNNLAGCCKYDRSMKMNQGKGSKPHHKEEHKH